MGYFAELEIELMDLYYEGKAKEMKPEQRSHVASFLWRERRMEREFRAMQEARKLRGEEELPF